MAEHDPDGRESDAGSGVSRRSVVAGAILGVGASARLVDGRTLGLFSDAGMADGTVQVDGDPTLNYQLTDETQNNNAEYEIAYQVEWVGNYDRIEIQVENIDDPNIAGDTFTRTTTDGTVSYPSGGGSDGGAAGDTYRFTFEVYENGNSTPVIQEVVEDQADGSGTGEGDFGDSNSPEIEWVIVLDDTQNNNGDFTVFYEVTNLTEFGQVVVTFEDTDKPNATRTKTNSNSPNGKATYAQGGTEGHAFDILVEAEDQNGLVTDSVTINDVADGTDPSGYGDPVRSDSPLVDSFTLTDNSASGETRYSLDYTLTSTTRLDHVVVRFVDTDQAWATESYTHSGSSTTGSRSYSSWTMGDQFEITVETWETRNGVTFPVHSGTITDVSDGGSSKSWP